MAEFTYKPESTSKIYLKLFYGVCRQDSTAGTDHCLLWEDEEEWQYLDEMNLVLSNRQSLLAEAAANSWPFVKYVTILCLLLSFGLLVFYCIAACLGEIAWKVQMILGIVHLILTFLLTLSLGSGLRTDTVKPQMFGNFFYGCSVHAEPGAAWWFGVLELIISIFAGFILVFPYLGGPSWVLKWAKYGEVSPTEEDEYERHRDELELDDGSDPFAGIQLRDQDDLDYEELDDDDDEYEWETDEEEEDVENGQKGSDRYKVR